MRRHILAIVVLILLMCGLSYGADRGVRIRARLPSSGEMTTLYDKSWAVVIGVDRYENWPKLKFAVRDAKAVASFLRERGFSVFELYDRDATKQQIVDLIAEKLTDSGMIGEGDRVFIYFAGHGDTQLEEGYLMPVEALVQKSYESKAIPMYQLKRLIGKIPAKHLYLVLDACFSGMFFAKRGVPEVKESHPRYIQEITRRVAKQALTAGGKEPVSDSGYKRHSAFTGQFLEALEQGLADLNGDGFVTAMELNSYVTPRVSGMSEQTPKYGNLPGSEGGEFVFVLEEGITEAVSEAERAKAEAEAAKRETDRLRQQVEAARARKETEAAKAEAERLRRELARMKESEEKVYTPSGGEIVVNLPGGASMEMVWIEPGTFMMGSPALEEGRDGDEVQHRVRISEGFYLGKYEITEGQWGSVMGGTAANSDFPKTSISWDDVQGLITKLNGGGSETYRLPTEAEWEYACRAGSTTRWSSGDDERQLGGYAWYGANSGYEAHEVGTKRPNGWGLYDMYGNVWEWCEDWYGSYSSGNQVDPTGPVSGSYRVIRGGGFYHGALDVRSASRGRNSPGIRDATIGARLLR